MSTPRVTPGTARQLGPFGWAVSRLGARATGNRDVHIFSTLGRDRRLFPAWLAYSATMMPFGILPRTDTELVILRVAHVRGSAYERAHHERLGSRVGLTDAEIARTTEDPEKADWSPVRRVMLRAADELMADRDVSDATWAELSTHLDAGELVGFVQLVTQYDGLATSLHTLRVQRDEPRA